MTRPLFFCQMCRTEKEYGQDGGIEVQAHVYVKPYGEATIHTICAICFAKTQNDVSPDQLITRVLAEETLKVKEDGTIIP